MTVQLGRQRTKPQTLKVLFFLKNIEKFRGSVFFFEEVKVYHCLPGGLQTPSKRFKGQRKAVGCFGPVWVKLRVRLPEQQQGKTCVPHFQFSSVGPGEMNSMECAHGSKSRSM